MAGRCAAAAPPTTSGSAGFEGSAPSLRPNATCSWAERVYPNLIYWGEVDRGGHFAAGEEPELFATELRAAFQSLR